MNSGTSDKNTKLYKGEEVKSGLYREHCSPSFGRDIIRRRGEKKKEK